MVNDSFDDGLVHNHDWARASIPPVGTSYPVADVSNLRTVSTAYHDDHIEIG